MMGTIYAAICEFTLKEVKKTGGTKELRKGALIYLFSCETNHKGMQC